jgi:hypothetical protein
MTGSNVNENQAAQAGRVYGGAGGKRPGAGRKPVEIDLATLEKLYSLLCTDEDIAGYLGVSVRTIRKRLQRPEFAAARERGRARGRISVRRAQMKLVEAGNPAMTIFMGKQVLGQREVMPVELTGGNGQRIQIEVLDAILERVKKRPKQS